MDKVMKLMAQTPIMDGIAPGDIPKMLSCLAAKRRSFAKGAQILRAGDPARWIGLVLSGRVHVFSEDFTGNRTIVASMDTGEMFGEAFTCAGVVSLPVSAAAVETSEVLLLDGRRLMAMCDPPCPLHAQLIENMLRIVAANNVALNQKVNLVSRRTTREKLTAYLSQQAVRAGASCFEIPFDRQALADYLCVERSAMSAEISKMQKEGLIRTKRSTFEIVALPDEE